MTKVIAVDCDGVLLNNGELWLEYLLSNFNLKDPQQRLKGATLPYDISSLFEIPEGIDPYAYWKSSDLYDNLTPSLDACTVVTALCKQYEVVFVSRCMGNHHESKENFLKKWFPENAGIILTEHKNRVACDILVDDSVKVLNSMPDSVDCIRFRIDHNEGIRPRKNFPVCYNWGDVYKLIKEKCNVR